MKLKDRLKKAGKKVQAEARRVEQKARPVLKDIAAEARRVEQRARPVVKGVEAEARRFERKARPVLKGVAAEARRVEQKTRKGAESFIESVATGGKAAVHVARKAAELIKDEDKGTSGVVKLGVLGTSCQTEHAKKEVASAEETKPESVSLAIVATAAPAKPSV